MKMYDRFLPYIDAKPVDTMSILRGCPYQCAYCETRELWGTSCRAFSPQRVVDEIKNMIEHYGTKGIYFVGDNFTINKNRTIELCRKIKENKLDLKWTCETRADLSKQRGALRNEIRWVPNHIFWQSNRVQSGFNKNLTKISTSRKSNKPLSLPGKSAYEQLPRLCWASQAKLSRTCNATFKYAKTLKADVCMFNIYIACPGSKLYDEVISQHLYDQMDNYLARVKTKDFDYDMLVKYSTGFPA